MLPSPMLGNADSTAPAKTAGAASGETAVSPATGNQVACSGQSEAEIDDVASADVRAGGAEVSHHLTRCSAFLQRVSQYADPSRVQLAAGHDSLLVGGL